MGSPVTHRPAGRGVAAGPAAPPSAGEGAGASVHSKAPAVPRPGRGALGQKPGSPPCASRAGDGHLHDSSHGPVSHHTLAREARCNVCRRDRKQALARTWRNRNLHCWWGRNTLPPPRDTGSERGLGQPRPELRRKPAAPPLCVHRTHTQQGERAPGGVCTPAFTDASSVAAGGATQPSVPDADRDVLITLEHPAAQTGTACRRPRHRRTGRTSRPET